MKPKTNTKDRDVQVMIDSKGRDLEALIESHIKNFGLDAAVRIVMQGITEGHAKIDGRVFAYPLSEALERRMNDLTWHYPEMLEAYPGATDQG